MLQESVSEGGAGLDPRVAAYVARRLGLEALRVLDALAEKEVFTDVELADKLEMKGSGVRKLLYDLYELRIVGYNKEKDRATGWLTFFWFVSPLTLEKAREGANLAMKQLEAQMTKEGADVSAEAFQKRLAELTALRDQLMEPLPVA